jgi:hypothetical protein
MSGPQHGSGDRHRAHIPGAAVIGWSLIWSIPLLPPRVGGALREHPAFDVSIALSVAAIAGTVLCTAVTSV